MLIQTGADSLRMYLSGATSDGGAQSVEDDSRGKYRSSTEVQSLSFVANGAISNVTVNHVSGASGPGTGFLMATGLTDEVVHGLRVIGIDEVGEEYCELGERFEDLSRGHSESY